MRSSSFPVIIPALMLLLADQSLAQNQIRFVATAGAKSMIQTARRVEGPKLHKASQVVVEEPIAEDAGEAAYASGTFQSAGAAGGGARCGCAFDGMGGYGGVSQYGYNPDFGNLQGGMSVWPGVPACCDPWFGYCGEPRCNKCSCGKGRYLYYHCPCGACKPEILIWGKGASCGGQCGEPVAMCYAGKAGAGRTPCATCRAASCNGAACCTNKGAAGSDSCCGSDADATNGPAIEAAPKNQPAPPRNDLPTSGARSARRATSKPAA